MSLQDKLRAGRVVFTAEITPPKGAGIKKLSKHAELLKPHIDALNVTDCQRALVKMSSLATCRILLDLEIEPVFQLTCRDRNSIALQSDLMGASALGIPNVLCLTGDPVKVGDSQQSKPVFEVESTRLLEILGKLQSGLDANDHKLNAPTKLFPGAVVNPTCANDFSQLKRMEKKIAAGARFFQTQANYDLPDFRQFAQQARKLGVPVLAGVLVLHNYEVAKYIHDNIPGIQVPDSVLARFAESPESEETGLDFAVQTMEFLKDSVAGFHLMTIRREELIPEILKRYHEQNPASHATL